MSQVKKSFQAAIAIGLLAGSIVAGSVLRAQLDTSVDPFQARADSALRTSGLVASTTQSVPEADYFYEMSRLLKREYVDEIKDDQKLVSGAVRGMVSSLTDTKSIYMDADEFTAFKNARQGLYEGVGVDLEMVMPPKAAKKPAGDELDLAVVTLPKLMVTAVTPGGPAQKAGVAPGDIVVAIDKHWVLDGDLITRFRKAQRDFQAKKLSLAKLNELRKEVRAKTERSLMPLRAKERLCLGKTGATEVVWRRAGVERTTKLEKSVSRMPAFFAQDSAITLPFVAGSPGDLAKAVAGKTSLTIDLRNNVWGDLKAMESCLALVAPKGVYGQIVTTNGAKPKPFKLEKGVATAPQMTLLVDRSTRGAAEIFALALSSRGLAKLSGPSMGGDRTWTKVIQLPDGSGYTLATGEYRADGAAK
ncbi:MAG: S41 family peptidase [Fimbriimonas sp.]